MNNVYNMSCQQEGSMGVNNVYNTQWDSRDGTQKWILSWDRFKLQRNVACSALQCSSSQCTALQCSSLQCSALQYSLVQCIAVQCNAVSNVGEMCWQGDNGWTQWAQLGAAKVQHCTALHFLNLLCTVPYCISLHCSPLCFTALFCTVLETALNCPLLHCTVFGEGGEAFLLHGKAMNLTIAHCTAMRTILLCSALHYRGIL